YHLEKFYPPNFDPRAYWDARYAQEHIAGKSADEFRKQGFWPLLEKNLTKDKRYLDAGCGVGGWVIFLDEEGYNVEGIDIAARIIRALTEYNRDLKVKVAEMTQIPYADASFDGVLAIGVLEYVEGKVPIALAETGRVLKPGGMLFLEVPMANALRRWVYLPLKKIEKLVKTTQGKQPTFASYLFTHRSLMEQLSKAGFEIVEVRPHELPESDSHYGLYIDWKILRGSQPYKLNILGRIVKAVANFLSPWIASTGMVVVARKKL
ncbi:MAG: methyltransferase domain-containing protein, partial [Candidatus Andersenbacteria bacterium]|nr:methyltransferase domain-containing protein [Candidatus Andersenbacteria bacterium]